MTRLSLKTPKRLALNLIPYAQGGMFQEGRQNRSGWQMMKIGYMTHRYEINKITKSLSSIEELPGEIVPEYTIDGQFDLFIPYLLLDADNVWNRLESFGSWDLSITEEKLHLSRAKNAVNDSVFKYAQDILKSEIDAFDDEWLGYFQAVMEEGDSSRDQWKKFVHGHAGSMSHFGVRWSDIDENEDLMRKSYDMQIALDKTFYDDFKRSLHKGFLIRADSTVPALRSRKGDIVFLQWDNDGKKAKFRVKKKRNRKAGGQDNYQANEWRIYENHALKVKCYANHWKSCAKRAKLNESDYLFSARDGMLCYKAIVEKKLNCCDLKNGEKTNGLFWYKDYPFTVDLSHPNYPAELAAEMYSGMAGVTTLSNEKFVSICIRASNELEGTKVDFACSGGDNLAYRGNMRPSYLYENDERWLGFIGSQRRFGRTSFVTDNPKHRTGCRLPHIQQQTYQYFARPFLGVIMGDVYKKGSCEKFIDYCIANKIATDLPWLRHDDIYEDVVSREKQLEDMKTTFAGELSFTENFWPVQYVTPEPPTDLMRSPGN